MLFSSRSSRMSFIFEFNFPPRIRAVTAALKMLIATVSEHLGYFFAAERLIGASLCVPSFISAIKVFVREFAFFRSLDLLGDEVAQDIFICAIFFGSFDDTVWRQ